MNDLVENQAACPSKVLLSSPKAEAISIEECKKYLDKFDLSDEKVAEIRNYLIGIVDKSINLYLDGFR